jgi:hypothetical protein
MKSASLSMRAISENKVKKELVAGLSHFNLKSFLKKLFQTVPKIHEL